MFFCGVDEMRGLPSGFFRRLIRRRGAEPWKIVTDKLGSYRVAHRAWAPDSIHVTERYANNRAEQSHEATRAGYEAIQKRCPGPAFPWGTSGGIQPVQLGASLGKSQPLSGPEIPRLCVLGSGNGSLTERA